MLVQLIDEFGIINGISFGGPIALRHAIAHCDRLTMLVTMSPFAELSPAHLGTAMRNEFVVGGTFQDLLLL